MLSILIKIGLAFLKIGSAVKHFLCFLVWTSVMPNGTRFLMVVVLNLLLGLVRPTALCVGYFGRVSLTT